VNLAIFQATYARGAGHLAAATVAFLAAVTTNFVLNRRWTFAHAALTAKRVQGPRFLVVSALAFGVGLGVLEALVSLGHVPALAAQACSILVATPLNFAGQKLWSFRAVEGTA
jgi:putative flippase GtrA